MLGIAHAEAKGDEPDQKRVATRRLNDPVPGAATKRKSKPKALRRKKAPR